MFCFLPISRSEHTALYQRSLGKSNTRTAFPFLGRCSAGAFSIHELITGLCRSFAGPPRSSVECSAVRAVPPAIRHRVNRRWGLMLFYRCFTIRCCKQRSDIHISAARTRKAPKVPRFDFLCQCSFWLQVFSASLAVTDPRLVFIATIFAGHVNTS